MRTIKIQAYKFEELSEKATIKALEWLDGRPLDYQDAMGNYVWECLSYSYNEEPQYVADHCDINDYLFNVNGEPIHHLITE